MNAVQVLFQAVDRSKSKKIDKPLWRKRLLKIETKPVFKRFDRRRHVADVIRNVLENNGHAAAIRAATSRSGSIDWEKLIELILKYLPQILAIIIPLFV